ncbi:hypothetical protein NOY08_002534 [Serratia marcescens]
MDKFSDMSHAERIAYLASKVALAKSYDSPVLTVPIPDLEILLAELEAKDKRIAELEAIRADASQVFKEIGNELGCNPDNESIMMAIDKLKERLATPVRLPGFYKDADGNVWLNPVQVVKEIRRSGFTVEGDEQ